MQAALMMIDGFGLQGVTQLAVDSIFMMPHLGVFASVHPQAAYEIFEHDCIVHLGCSIVPVWKASKKVSGDLAEVFLDGTRVGVVASHTVSRIVTPATGIASLKVVPLHGAVDVGAGPGAVCERRITCGECGIVCDGRGAGDAAVQRDPTSFQRTVYTNLGLIR
jgi:hypothetical protein